MNLHVENGRHQQVPHDEDHDISRKIISVVVKQFLTANVASIVHLEEARNIRPLPQRGHLPRKPRTRTDIGGCADRG